MIIIRAYKSLNRNLLILLIPLLIDGAALTAGLSFRQLQESSKPSFIVIYEVGLPSLAHILDKPLLANTFKYLTGFQELPHLIVAVVIVFLLSNSLVQGAFIGLIHQIVNNKKVGVSDVFYYAKRFWLRFLLIAFILLLLQISVITLLFLFFQVIGSFLGMILFLILRIVFIYFEFVLVVYDYNFGGALALAYKFFKFHAAETYIVAPAIFAAAGLMSYLLHHFWSLGGIISFIVLYAYIMTGLQIALMMSFRRIKAEIDID